MVRHDALSGAAEGKASASSQSYPVIMFANCRAVVPNMVQTILFDAADSHSFLEIIVGTRVCRNSVLSPDPAK